LELKISIEGKKGANIEKYVENKLRIKIKNKLKKFPSGFEPIAARPSGRLFLD
jgi:hypothetical protein